jgi:hypothetical protein
MRNRAGVTLQAAVYSASAGRSQHAFFLSAFPSRTLIFISYLIVFDTQDLRIDRQLVSSWSLLDLYCQFSTPRHR